MYLLVKEKLLTFCTRDKVKKKKKKNLFGECLRLAHTMGNVDNNEIIM